MTITKIDRPTLEHLVTAGAIDAVTVYWKEGGWVVLFKFGKTVGALTAREGNVRNFRNFETLTGFLKDVGVQTFAVDARQYDPGQQKSERVRTDAADRMRRIHQIAKGTRLQQTDGMVQSRGELVTSDGV